MTRWEFREVRGASIEDQLNELGQEAWELAHIQAFDRAGKVTLVALLKRECKRRKRPKQQRDVAGSEPEADAAVT